MAGNNEIVTDRPDITESAIVVPKGSLQVRNGFTWASDRHLTLLNLCQSLVRAGADESIELRLSLPSHSETLFGNGKQSGLSDISIGLKRQLGPLWLRCLRDYCGLIALRKRL